MKKAQELIARLTGFTDGKWVWSKGSQWGGTWLFSAGKPVLDYDGCGSHDSWATQADRNMIAAAPDLHRELTAALAREAALRGLLAELYAMVKGECPSLLNVDSGGNDVLDLNISAALEA